jgi:hypothetical protein
MITELRTPAEPLVRGLNLRGRPAGELRFAARPDLADRGKPHDE